jgi:TonB family protein
MRLILLLAAAGLTAQTAPAPAPVTPQFATAGQWVVDYSLTGCVLQRSFSDGKETISFGIVPLTGSESVSIALISSSPTRFRRSGKAALTPTPTGTATKGDFFSMINKGKALAYVRASRSDIAAWTGAARLTVAAGGMPATLPMPGLRKALAAMATCETDLIKSWGFDPAEAVTPPQPIDPQRWITDEDYPRMALMRGLGGQTDFRVTVSPEGKPLECFIVLSSLAPELDDKACSRIMARSKFVPARDKAGNPVRGLYSNQVRWWVGR